jgi:hypothetical protein
LDLEVLGSRIILNDTESVNPEVTLPEILAQGDGILNQVRNSWCVLEGSVSLKAVKVGFFELKFFGARGRSPRVAQCREAQFGSARKFYDA